MMEWMAFYNIDPWGETRADLRAGIIASTTYNVQRGKGQARKASEFMPDFEEKEEQTIETMKIKLLSATGAKIKDG